MRWRHLVPPAVAVATVLAATALLPGPVGAADPPWTPPACDSTAQALGRAAGSAVARGMAWFRLDGILDGRATLVGRRLAVGDATAASRRRLDLPAESFVSGPTGDVVLVGSDDGRRSTLRLVDPVAGCATHAGTSTDVVRSALLTPAGDAVVEHRVDRRTRADLGVWRRPLDAAAATQLLGPVPGDAAYGRTFVTELAWGPDGRLAVVSCGEVRCRARIVDPASGAVSSVSDIGPLVGLTDAALVVQAPCRGLPCPIESVALATGDRRVLVTDAGLATLVGSDGDVLAWESLNASGTLLHRTHVGSGATVDLGRLPDGYFPLLPAARSGSGIAAPTHRLAVMPDGRVPLDVARGRGHLIDPLDGRPAGLREVSR